MLEIQQQMPHHLGATLTASDHGDNPTGYIGGMEQVIVRMEHEVADVTASPRRNCRHESGPKHDVPGVDHPAIDVHGKHLLVGQAGGHPLQVLIEFFATDRLRTVDEAVEPLMRAEECEKRVLTRGIGQCHEVFQVRDLDDGLRKQQAGVPFEIRALVEETGVEAGWREQCREAQVEGTCTHADGAQCQISSQNLSPQASPSNRYNRLPTCCGASAGREPRRQSVSLRMVRCKSGSRRRAGRP